MDQDETWHGRRPRPLCVRWDPVPPPKKGTALTQFSAHMSVVARRLDGSRCHVCGTEVGLGTGDIALDGDPAPLKRGHSTHPTFWPISNCGQTAGWIKMPLVRSRPRPRPDCVRFGPSSPPRSLWFLLLSSFQM